MASHSPQLSAVVAFAFLTFIAASVSAASAPVRLGAECRLADDPHEYYSRFVTFRPADGSTVSLNPPRFSWPYVPEIFPDEKGTYPPNQLKQVGKISAYKEGDGYVYFAGDASNAYQKTPHLRRFIRHVLYMRKRYFVLLDDLGVHRAHAPSTFQWLYHVYPDTPLRIEPERGAFSYRIGNANVVVQHVAHVGDLELTDRQCLDGLVNPLTGEDYRERWQNLQKAPRGQKPPLFAHNLWVANRTPAHDYSFLAVIFPYREGEAPPAITRLDDLTVRVAHAGGEDTVSFNPKTETKADIVVDYEAMR